MMLYQICLQMDQQSYFDYVRPRCDLDIEDSEPIFPQDTLPHNSTPQYQIW